VQIKRFEAENITQALQAVKAEFGAEAVILETRRVGGKNGGVQVTAAFEPKAAAAGARRTRVTLPAEGPDDAGSGRGSGGRSGSPVTPAWARSRSSKGVPNAAMPLDTMTKTTGTKTAAARDAARGHGATATLTLDAVESALSPLKAELTAVGAALKARKDDDGGEWTRVSTELAQLKSLLGDLVLDRRTESLPEPARAACRTLTGLGLPRELAADLAASLPDGDPARLEDHLAARIPVAGPLLGSATPRRVMFVGPTGVGKTTTIAKLAAHFAVSEKRKVALVTLDTYRIGAVEQVATYARIIGVPSAVAADRAELKAALEAFSDRDLVLIDTAGRSPKDPVHVPALAELRPEGVAVQLVLPATRSVADHAAILAAYAPLAPTALVLTKLDEAQGLGSALHTALTAGTPVSYLANGQRVPEDLHLASGARLAAQFLAGGAR
jgi:flagellar biosynthesis protein FlhF